MPDTSQVTPEQGSVTMFTTTWCGYCTRLKGQLAREGVPFTEIDLEANPEHVDLVEQVNGGNRTVPTVVFPDGSAATNPSLAEVRSRLAG
jgi:mycoredoxin